MLIRKEMRLMVAGIIVFIPIAVISLVFGLPMSSVWGAADGSKLDVVIDADPGADDAMAILMMLSRLSKANVLAITISSGNTGVHYATRNAKMVLQVANRSDIPVYSGSEHGLVYKAEVDAFFGYDGLGDAFLTELSTLSSTHAAIFLAEIVRQNPDQITVLVTGPLTNIALALHINPHFLNQVKDIVILGGSYQGGGNKKPGVEFNIYADPDAAALVFSKAPTDKLLTVVPIETIKALEFNVEWRRSVLGKVNSCSMDFLNKAESSSLSKSPHWYPFDQTAASVLLEPTVITSTEEAFIQVETCGNLARGAFLRDDGSVVKNTRLITSVNKSFLEEILIKYINSSSGVCI